MNEIIVINGQSVEFEVVGDQTFTTSLDISKVFEKEHKNIIAQIEALPADKFRQLNFQPSCKPRLNGFFVKDTKFYNLTRDGFSLLVMGFTGEKAYRWKIEFIAAFNKMEAMIKNASVANDKFNEVLTALKDKSSEADEFKSKYYAAIERENMLLRQNFQAQGDMVKKSSRLNQSEKDEIVRLYKSGLSQGEICRRMDRSRDAVRNAIRGVL